MKLFIISRFIYVFYDKTGEIRIHLQRVPLPQRNEIQVREIPIEVLQARPNMIRPIQAIRLQSVPDRESQPNFGQRNEVPSLRETLGLTNEDLMNIQRIAQERIEQELRSLAQEDDSNSSENDDSDDDNSEENPMIQGQSNAQQQSIDRTKSEGFKRKCLILFLV